MRIMSGILVIFSLLFILYLSVTNGSIRAMILQLAVLILSLSNLEGE